MRRRQIVPLAILLLGACSSPKAPSVVYEEYNQQIIAGMAFEEEVTYFTKRKQQEVEAQFPPLMDRTNRTRDEVIELYQTISRELAKCKQISLAEEQIEGNTAYLVYDQRDICGNASESNEKHSVRMVDEGGWKIDDVEIAL